MKSNKNILVVCIDKDNDLGRKANVSGPIIGRENNLKAAVKLGVKDPEDSDINSILGAVKKFDEVKEFYESTEIATLTGYGKEGFKSDKKINEQLDKVLELFPADGIVFVSDGAEDDQVLPILQSRAPVISKQMIIVKQASEVESTYYTIKEALKDPFLARIVFGVPGIILLLYFALGSISLQMIALIFGLYLLAKGFGIEEKIISTSRNIVSSFSIQRTSFPFYIGSIFIFAFGIITGYSKFFTVEEIDLLTQIVLSAQVTYLFLVLTVLSFIVGRCIDAVHLKKAFYLRKYFLSGVSTVMIWFILDAGTQVFLRKADLNFFLMSIILSFTVLLIAFRLTSIFDVRRRLTKLLVGLPVYSKEGKWIGKVENIYKAKKIIEFKENKSKKIIKIGRKNFIIKKGKIVLVS